MFGADLPRLYIQETIRWISGMSSCTQWKWCVIYNSISIAILGPDLIQYRYIAPGGLQCIFSRAHEEGSAMSGVATQFPTQSRNLILIKFKFYCEILIWNIILSQFWTRVWILSNPNQGLFYPIQEILILSTFPYQKWILSFYLITASAPHMRVKTNWQLDTYTPIDGTDFIFFTIEAVP